MEQPAPKPFNLGVASRILLLLACTVVVIAGMRAASSVITPILLAFMITIIFLPLQSYLIQRGVRPWLALLIALLLILLAMSIFITLTIISINQFINRIPTYQVPLENIFYTLEAFITQLPLPIEVSKILNFDFIDIPQVINLSAGILRNFLDVVSNWLLILLLVAFMLLDFAQLPEKLARSFKNKAEIGGILTLIDAIRRYISSTALAGLVIGTLNALLLMGLGVDFAILWGILAFIMDFIPNVGIIISIIPPVVLALLEYGWLHAILVVASLVLINAAVENILKPKIMEENLNISPLFVILSLILWSFVLGVAGTILAIPLTIIVTKLVLERSDETNWLALLMTANPKVPRVPRLPRRIRRMLRKEKHQQDEE